MLNEGMYLSDRYEIVGKVGAGGMSDVYKAKDHILGRFVAIKVLKAEFSEDMNFVTKFRTEAQSAASLEHPNIVNIYDVGSENGMHFIVMEYVEGITLKTYIEKKQQLSFKEAVSISIQVARGIEAAHNKNIIHRDIKPQNIIISTDGKVKVTDFGIARAASSNTISSDVMGSVHYASPEQARNGFVDGRSDIYSLGIMMYEMVTGRVPFDGDTTVAVAIQHLQEEMTKPSTYAPELPISMEKIILKCTQKSPERRYQNVGDLLMDLRKSLISPDEDFVVIAPPAVDATKTKIISEDEVKQLNELAGEEGEENPDGVEGEDEDDEDEEGMLSPKMEKVMTIGGIVVGILLVVFIIILIGNIVGLFHIGKKDTESESQTVATETESEEKVEMIDLTGMTVDEAEEALEKAGYDDITVFVYAYEEDDDYEDGQIISQDPEEGEKISTRGTVNVTICGEEDSKNSVKVPDVTGLTEDAAASTLKGENLQYEKEYEYSDTVESGKVISQTPTAGSSAQKKTTVKIVVSQGSAPATVPDVTGLSQSDAQAKLEAAGLTLGSVTTKNDEEVPEGKVISQGQAIGKELAKGTSVDIVVSAGAAKAKTYSFSKTITMEEGTAYYSYELVNGNSTLASNGKVDASNTKISASGLAVSSGTLTVHFFDESGTEINKITTTENFTAE